MWPLWLVQIYTTTGGIKNPHLDELKILRRTSVLFAERLETSPIGVGTGKIQVEDRTAVAEDLVAVMAVVGVFSEEDEVADIIIITTTPTKQLLQIRPEYGDRWMGILNS